MEPADEEEQQGLSSVARQVNFCLRLFETCLNKAASIGPKQLSLVDDQVAKFCIWKDSAGIHSKGRGSFDYRLRDAPNARGVVLGLLEGLSYRLEHCIGILDSTEIVQACNEVPSAETELQDALREIGNEIDLFHNFANTVRRASRQAQNQKALRNFRIRDADNNDLEPFLHQLFANYIRDRFPGTSDSIRKRLADTMLIRRKRILYRRSRYGEPSSQKPRGGAYEIRRPIRVRGNQSPRGSYRKPQSSAAQESLEETVDTGGSIAPTATTLKSRDFQKALAPSVVSISKTLPLSNQSELPFPPSPCDAINRQYEKLKKNVNKDLRDVLDAEKKEKLEQMGQITCQYCFLTLPAHAAADEITWRLHVKEDLDPYVCLFESCPSGEQLYSHSQEWLSHMGDHCLQWFCNAKSHGKLLIDTKEGYIDHIKAIHPGKLTDAQIGVLADRNVKSLSPMFSSCPLCGVAEEENMEDHITGHMRLIALRSLPPYQENARGLEDSFSQASVSIIITNPRARSTILDDSQEMLSSGSDFGIDLDHSNFQELAPPRPFRGSGTGHETSGDQSEQHGNHLGRNDANQPADVYSVPGRGFLHVLDYQTILADETNAKIIGAYEPTLEFFDERVYNQIPAADKRIYEWGFLPGVSEVWENPSQDPILRNLRTHMIGAAEKQEMESKALDKTTNALHEVNESLSHTPDKADMTTTGIESSTQTTIGQRRAHLSSPGDGGQMRYVDRTHVTQLESLENQDIPTNTPEEAWTNHNFGRAHSLLKGLRNPQQIRIAVMGTGCHKDIPHFRKHPEDLLRIVWKDFVESNGPGSADMVDEDCTSTSLGHGSLIVSLLLNLAPTAVIYVCRVCRKLESATNTNTTSQLSSALDWAETRVDITIAGLMVVEERPPLERVKANKTTISTEKDAGVGRVFFANGRRQQLMSDSITVLGVDQYRAQLPYSGRLLPWAPRGRTFCTMAKEIPCDWTGNRISGYEVAAVILAALAAVFLEYDSSDNACEAAEDSNLPTVIITASDRDIIQSLFCLIGTEMGKDQWYIDPTKLSTSLTRDAKSFYGNIRKRAMQNLLAPLHVTNTLKGQRSITQKRRRELQT